jgi:hypothetical protein
MGALRRPKPTTRAKSVHSGKRLPSRKTRRKATNRSPAELPEIPEGIREEIENQRGVLGTVITLLHSLHLVLEHQQDEFGVELSAGAEAAVGWVNLPDMTEMLLERVHTVHLALDSVCLARALKAFKE